MEVNEDFKSYKKVLLFGSEGEGKSTLAKRLQTGEFEENIPQKVDGKSL